MEWDEQRLGRHLKLRDLNVLSTVARCGSMGKAAAQLAVSQPAISKAIAEMEYTLGVRLLDRGPLGAEPTIYGRVLLDRGLVAFDELRQAVKHIEFLADPTAGEVRVATPVILASGFVAAVADRISRRHPRIVVHLLAAESGMTYRALEERKAEMVIVGIFGPVAEEHLSAEILYHETYVVVAGAQNPWTRRRKIALADLLNEPWTLPPPDSLTGSLMVEAFRAEGLDFPRATVVTSSTPARNALLATGRFLTIVPSSALKFCTWKPELKALPIDMPTARRPIGILTLKNRTLSPVAQLFIDCAREIAKPLTRGGRSAGMTTAKTARQL
jgi:DNA-binding transcriptional LysR family regulator